MLNKHQTAALELPIAFLAVKAPAAGEETASHSASATTYTDGESFVIANVGEGFTPLSPFNGKPLKELASREIIEFAKEDFVGDNKTNLTLACTCGNEKCGVSLYTSPEISTKLAGEEFHCTVCATVNKIEALANDDSEEDLTEDEVEEIIRDAEDEDDDDSSDPDSDDVTTDDEDESSVASSEETTSEAADEITASETPAVVEDPAVETPPETVVAEADAVVTEVVEQTETASVEEEEEVASMIEEISTLTINVTEGIDFAPETASVVPMTVDGSRFALLALDKDSRKTVVVAYLDRDAAKEDLRGLFNPTKPKLLRDAVLAAAEDGDVTAIGFEPITATVDVHEEALRLAEDKALAAVEEKASTLDGYHEAFNESLQIAMVGMNKGTYVNPLLDELAAALDNFGIENAGHVAAKVLDTAAHGYALALFDKAQELASLPEESRKVVAKTIEGQVSSLLTAPIKTPAKQPTEMVATAELEIPPTRVEGERASAHKQSDGYALFADLGLSPLAQINARR